VLDDAGGKQAVGELVQQWAGLAKLKTRIAQYQEKHADETAVDKKNKAQQQLREAFDPFFTALHEGLKRLDKVVRLHEKQQVEQAQAEGKRAAIDRKINALKGALEELHKEVSTPKSSIAHPLLQERFPKANMRMLLVCANSPTGRKYRSRTIRLNAGRYVEWS